MFAPNNDCLQMHILVLGFHFCISLWNINVMILNCWLLLYLNRLIPLFALFFSFYLGTHIAIFLLGWRLALVCHNVASR